MAEDDLVICIDSWPFDETYEGIYPKGAREKDVYFSPSPTPLSFIKPAHRYMHKKPFKRYPWQFWIEITAYRVGQIIGVEVPPAYVGLVHESGGKSDIYGALIEWFYTPPEEGYIDGGAFMVQAIKDFDVKEGTQHNLATILDIRPFTETDRWINYWAGVLAFDSLIGNRDRHQENWGLIFNRESLQNAMKHKELLGGRARESPAFDNGTSLGHEILEENLSKFDDDAVLFRYATNSRARHHMKWSLEDRSTMNFFKFMQKFATACPFTKERIYKILDFSLDAIEERLRPLITLVDDPVYCYSEHRLEFMLRLIGLRRNLLLEALGK